VCKRFHSADYAHCMARRDKLLFLESSSCIKLAKDAFELCVPSIGSCFDVTSRIVSAERSESSSSSRKTILKTTTYYVQPVEEHKPDATLNTQSTWLTTQLLVWIPWIVAGFLLVSLFVIVTTLAIRNNKTRRRNARRRSNTNIVRGHPLTNSNRLNVGSPLPNEWLPMTTFPIANLRLQNHSHQPARMRYNSLPKLATTNEPHMDPDNNWSPLPVRPERRRSLGGSQRKPNRSEYLVSVQKKFLAPPRDDKDLLHQIHVARTHLKHIPPPPRRRAPPPPTDTNDQTHQVAIARAEMPSDHMRDFTSLFSNLKVTKL